MFNMIGLIKWQKMYKIIIPILKCIMYMDIIVRCAQYVRNFLRKIILINWLNEKKIGYVFV